MTYEKISDTTFRETAVSESALDSLVQEASALQAEIDTVERNTKATTDPLYARLYSLQQKIEAVRLLGVKTSEEIIKAEPVA